jgi:hypothetical protein
MKSQRQEIEEKTLIWVSYADEDLSTAHVGLTLTTSIPYRIIDREKVGWIEERNPTFKY